MENILRIASIFTLLASPFAAAACAGANGFRWAVFGALSWVVGVALKMPLAAGLARLLRRATPMVRAAGQGVLSGACELGAAAAAVVWLLPGGTVAHGVAFGVGAGGIEILVLLVVATRAATQAPAPGASLPGEATPDSLRVRWTFVVERATALLGHSASRGLVWLALRGRPLAAAAALVLFGAVDGVAYYGAAAKWDWLEARTWRRFYGFVLAVALIEWTLLLALA